MRYEDGGMDRLCECCGKLMQEVPANRTLCSAACRMKEKRRRDNPGGKPIPYRFLLSDTEIADLQEACGMVGWTARDVMMADLNMDDGPTKTRAAEIDKVGAKEILGRDQKSMSYISITFERSDVTLFSRVCAAVPCSAESVLMDGVRSVLKQ